MLTSTDDQCQRALTALDGAILLTCSMQSEPKSMCSGSCIIPMLLLQVPALDWLANAPYITLVTWAVLASPLITLLLSALLLGGVFPPNLT